MNRFELNPKTLARLREGTPTKDDLQRILAFIERAQRHGVCEVQACCREDGKIQKL